MQGFRLSAPRLLIAGLLPVCFALTSADTEKRDPLQSKTREDVQVRLVLIDTVVVDSEGRTVGDLASEDFEIFVDGVRRPIDSLDTSCSTGGADDPRGVRHPGERIPFPGEQRNRIVLALDYQHLSQARVYEVIDRAKEIVQHSTAPGDEIMLAALIGGLRIEQGFTEDREQIVAALERMQYDVSLWAGHYDHSHDGGMFDGLEALLQVVGTVEGPKAMLLFSDLVAPSDADDPRFAEVAARAATSRCAIHTIRAEGLIAARPG